MWAELDIYTNTYTLIYSKYGRKGSFSPGTPPFFILFYFLLQLNTKGSQQHKRRRFASSSILPPFSKTTFSSSFFFFGLHAPGGSVLEHTRLSFRLVYPVRSCVCLHFGRFSFVISSPFFSFPFFLCCCCCLNQYASLVWFFFFHPPAVLLFVVSFSSGLDTFLRFS